MATVGGWNQEARMSPQVARVWQNLVMLVDNGQVNPSCGSAWGATVGNAAFIDRYFHDQPGNAPPQGFRLYPNQKVRSSHRSALRCRGAGPAALHGIQACR
ncbi:MAG TPA: hypothetical protein VGN81_16305 [Pseudonocardiaceae bacterium]